MAIKYDLGEESNKEIENSLISQFKSNEKLDQILILNSMMMFQIFETDKIKLDAAFVQRFLNTRKRHGATAYIFLIIAVSADRSAAVIPEDQDISVCGVILVCVFNEALQGLRIGHCARTHIALEAFELAAADDLVDLVIRRGYDTVLPILASARVNDDIYIVGKSGVCHLHEVIRSHTGPGL